MLSKFLRALLHTIGAGLVLLLSALVFASSLALCGNEYEIPAFIYHHILLESENTLFRNDVVITPERFEEQMRLLYERGYKTVTLDELYGFLLGNNRLSGKRVLITFDDGYLSNYRYAYDILKKYGYTAAIFTITSALNEEPAEFDPDKPVMLSIPEMAASGDVFEFASHTHNMHSTDIDGTPFLLIKTLSEVSEDTRISFSYPEINKYLAYPYGDFNDNTVTALKENDCRLAFTIRKRYITKYSDPFMLPRFTMPASMTDDEFTAILDSAVN